MDTRAYVHTPFATPQFQTLLRITCFFWLLAKVLSMKAWLADRLYPVVPVFDFTNGIGSEVHQVLFYISCTCLVGLFVFPGRRELSAFLLVAELCSCLLDIIRWQPWEFQYIFTLVIFLTHKNNPKGLYSAFVFLMASIYIFSGLHKLNGGFLNSIWESMILRRFFGVEKISDISVHYAGLVLPAIEIVCGFGLLFLKKKWPALVLIAMHLFILLFLGQLGLNYNSIVWPWNAAMIFLLYSLFIKIDAYTFSFRYMIRGSNTVVLLFWGLLPILSFSGNWEQYLSSSLYSGDNLNMTICVKNSNEVYTLKKYFSKSDFKDVCSGDAKITLQSWSFAEMRVAPYPEKWYYRRFKKVWERIYGSDNARFILRRYPYNETNEIK